MQNSIQLAECFVWLIRILITDWSYLKPARCQFACILWTNKAYIIWTPIQELGKLFYRLLTTYMPKLQWWYILPYTGMFLMCCHLQCRLRNATLRDIRKFQYLNEIPTMSCTSTWQMSFVYWGIFVKANDISAIVELMELENYWMSEI